MVENFLKQLPGAPKNVLYFHEFKVAQFISTIKLKKHFLGIIIFINV